MEKTPSVTISEPRPSACCRPHSRCSVSQWSYTNVSAFESRQPSMIEAWLSASENTTSPSRASVDTTPALAR